MLIDDVNQAVQYTMDLIGIFAFALSGGILAVRKDLLSSLLALEVPPLLRWNTDLYAVPALAGGVMVILLRAAGLLNAPTALAAALLGFGLRLLAQRRGWRTPRSSFWRDPFAGLRLQRAPEPPRGGARPDDGTADEARTAVLRLPESPTLHPAAPPRPSRCPASARRVAPTGPTARTATPGTTPVAAGAAGRASGRTGVVTAGTERTCGGVRGPAHHRIARGRVTARPVPPESSTARPAAAVRR
ncbi:hypothetical protein B9W64_35995 [Streptomyces sp. CS159]|uniref:hypothetical protein n=1 Tax=Streptomyces sp. CS159 TaxID=1982762 RepID=UPI000B40CA37|nr:hypothetical protein [Streptomyces sp. CS159]OWA01416.1 hypothetical protein B9W64_35995 [Streptomyces sp. CS159]